MTLYRPRVPENRSAIRPRRIQKLKFHTLKCLPEAFSRSTALKSNLTGKWDTQFAKFVLFFFVLITMFSTASTEMTMKTLIRIVDFRCEIWTGVLANKKSWAELQKMCLLFVFSSPDYRASNWKFWWKKVVAPLLNIIFRHLNGRNEENHGSTLSGRSSALWKCMTSLAY